MALAKYDSGSHGAWEILHDGRAANTYRIKAAQAAISAASLALRPGRQLIVTRRSGYGTEPTTGGIASGWLGKMEKLSL
jgi:hypothetical protein